MESLDLNLLFNIISGYIKSFIVSYDQGLYPILIEIFSLKCQPLHHRCFDVVVVVIVVLTIKVIL